MQIEALLLDGSTFLVGVEAVLSEAPVRAFLNRRCHLLSDFDEVTTRDNAEVDSLGLHLVQRFDHVLTNSLPRRRQGRVDVEECDDAFLLLSHPY